MIKTLQELGEEAVGEFIDEKVILGKKEDYSFDALLRGLKRKVNEAIEMAKEYDLDDINDYLNRAVVAYFEELVSKEIRFSDHLITKVQQAYPANYPNKVDKLEALMVQNEGGFKMAIERDELEESHFVNGNLKNDSSRHDEVPQPGANRQSPW